MAGSQPEVAQVVEMQTAAEYRAMWDGIERMWSTTIERASRLPESVLQERVDDEWSFVETLRHLVFATDCWASRCVLDEPMPYHRLGVTQDDYPRAEAAAIGIDLDARPSFADVMEVRAGRMAIVRGIVDTLTDAQLERMCTRSPAPLYDDEQYRVGRCLQVVMKEECAHHGYATRDLALFVLGTPIVVQPQLRRAIQP